MATRQLGAQFPVNMLKRQPVRIAKSLFVLALLFFAACTESLAYYDDTHYHMTYYLARLSGFTHQQAFRMASAAVAIDYSPYTEPCQYADEWSGLSRENQLAIEKPRVQFHAFIDEMKHPNILSTTDLSKKPQEERQAQNEIVAQRDYLFKMATSTPDAAGNLGVFLHFFQDEFSHAGYGSRGGHWFFGGGAKLRGRPLGSYCDWLCSYTQEKHLKMARETVSYMRKFMQHFNAEQFKNTQPVPDAEIVKIVTLFRNLNVQPFPTMADPTLTSPNYESVSKVLHTHLRDQNCFDSLPEHGIQYRFSPEGIPFAEHRDNWSMWENLTIRLVPQPTVGPIDVVCKISPNPTKPPYVVAQAQVPKGESETTFKKLPVGQITVEASYAGTLLASNVFELKSPDQAENLAMPGVRVVTKGASPSLILAGQTTNLKVKYTIDRLPPSATAQVDELIMSPATETAPARVIHKGSGTLTGTQEQEMVKQIRIKSRGKYTFPFLLSSKYGKASGSITVVVDPAANVPPNINNQALPASGMITTIGSDDLQSINEIMAPPPGQSSFSPTAPPKKPIPTLKSSGKFDDDLSWENLGSSSSPPPPRRRPNNAPLGTPSRYQYTQNVPDTTPPQVPQDTGGADGTTDGAPSGINLTGPWIATIMNLTINHGPYEQPVTFRQAGNIIRASLPGETFPFGFSGQFRGRTLHLRHSSRQANGFVNDKYLILNYDSATDSLRGELKSTQTAPWGASSVTRFSYLIRRKATLPPA